MSIQTRENHVRFDPWFHFLLTPLSLVLLIWSGVVHFQQKTVESFFVSAGFLILFLTIFRMRIYSMKVQDRVIRLEERLRLERLGDEVLRARIPELTVGQFVALRFASDAEVAALAIQALNEKLKGKQIKALIQNWRPDYFRI